MGATIKHLNRGYAVALLGALLLSTTAIFIRYLTRTYQMPPLLLAFWRDALVALFLFPALALRPGTLRVERPALRYLVFYGLLVAVFNALWTLSVAINGAAVATVLAYSSTGFTALLGWAFLRERLDWAKLAAIALSLSGCVLVTGLVAPGAWELNAPGIVTGVLTGVAYAVYTLMGRSASNRGLNPWATLAYSFGFAALFLLVANLIPGGPLPGSAARPGELFWLGDSLVGWGILLLLAGGPTILGFGLYNVSLTYLPSSIANLIVSLEPALTAIIAYLALGERLTLVQIAGGLLIVGAVVIVRVYEGWLARQPRLDEPVPAGTR